MNTYPITPDYILRLPQKTESAMRELEEFILEDICGRLQVNQELTATAAQHIMILHDRGYDMTRVSRKLSQMTGIAERELRRAMLDVMREHGNYYSELYEACGSDIDPVAGLAAEIDAISRATQLEMANITRSFGFSLRGPSGVMQWYDPAHAYQKVLDDALVKVNAGISYDQSIRSAVQQLAKSGIQTVVYDRQEDGTIKRRVNRADVAARRAIMTGVTKMSQAYADKACADLHTAYVEVTAHAGARDVDKPNPWSNHKAWQGQVYCLHYGDKAYCSVYAVCGLGEPDGLCGINCRHTYHPFIPGVMERTYTDDELAHIDKPPFTYDGHAYTTYEATQVMRDAETSMRSLKRRMIADSASGDREKYIEHMARFRTLETEYKRFANVAGLKGQSERANIPEWGPKEARNAVRLLAANWNGE